MYFIICLILEIAFTQNCYMYSSPRVCLGIEVLHSAYCTLDTSLSKDYYSSCSEIALAPKLKWIYLSYKTNTAFELPN